MKTPARLTAKRCGKGWVYSCHTCERGYMARGPMQQHLMGKVHVMSVASASTVMDGAERWTVKREARANGIQPTPMESTQPHSVLSHQGVE